MGQHMHEKTMSVHRQYLEFSFLNSTQQILTSFYYGLDLEVQT